MTNGARWTITGLDDDYLWVLQRSLEMYGEYLESLPSGPPADIEPGYEEHLENRGATVIDSTTYYPASNTKLTKITNTFRESGATNV